MVILSSQFEEREDGVWFTGTDEELKQVNDMLKTEVLMLSKKSKPKPYIRPQI